MEEIKIGEETLQLRMRNEIGPMYRYEQMFGSVFYEDIAKAESAATRAATMLKLVWAVIENDNERVEATWDQMMREADEKELAKALAFVQRRLMEIHGMNQAVDEESQEKGEGEEEAKKKE